MPVGALASSSRVDSSERWSPAGSSASECLLVVGLLFVAAVVRYPELWTVPPFSGDVDSVLFGLGVQQGRFSPFATTAPQISPLFAILIAGVWQLIGPSVYGPRLMGWTIGLLAVGATYLLGRSWGGRVGGAVAALLLATNLVHAASSSHLASGDGLGVLLVCSGLVALYRAGTAGRSWSARTAIDQPRPGVCWTWPLAGLLLGLAVAAQPITALTLPGCLLWVLPRIRSTGRRDGLLALLAFLIGSGPLLIAQLSPGPGELAGRGGSLGGGASPINHTEELLRFPVLVASAQLQQIGGLGDTVVNPGFWLGVGMIGLGPGLSARRGNCLPLLVIGSMLALSPLAFDGRELLPERSELAAILPVTYSAFGATIALVWQRLRRAIASDRQPDCWRWSLGLLMAGLAFLTLLPLSALVNFYESSSSTNASILQAVRAIQREARPAEPVVLDSGLILASSVGEGPLGRILVALLVSGGRPVWRTEASPARLFEALAGQASGLAILGSDRLEPLQGDFRIELLARASELKPNIRFDFVTVRLTPRQTLPTVAQPSGAVETDPLGVELERLTRPSRQPVGGPAR